ncbi:MAG: hypothetical protein C0424_08865 [Sphingobacteriaceae bacterium]|nr:hypothetical protein [Sphingobacteriaceae bacterium]
MLRWGCCAGDAAQGRLHGPCLAVIEMCLPHSFFLEACKIGGACSTNGTTNQLNTMKRFLFKSILGLLLSTQSLQAQQTLLWEVSGNGLRRSSYLFGTHHLVPVSFFDHHPIAKSSFKKSKQLVVEVVVDSMEMMRLMPMMLSTDGGAWVQQLSEAEKSSLDSLCKSVLGAGLEAVASLKPAALHHTLALVLSRSVLNDTLRNFTGAGIDFGLVQQAKSTKRKTVPLETLDQQFGLLYHTTLDSQLNDLRKTIYETDSMQLVAARLLKSYLHQDMSDMTALLQEIQDSGLDPMHALLRDRNRAWVPQLEQLFREKRTFVAVGSLHLPGEQGLISLLRAAGYTVKPVRNPDKKTYDKENTDAAGSIVIMGI